MVQRCARIALLSDFGDGPYVGQMRLRLSQLVPDIPVVTLTSDLPAFRPDLAAYLLAGLQAGMPRQTVYCCVVDPGVGTNREVIIARCGEDWWLGPDNGLLVPLLQGHTDRDLYRLRWRPRQLSASFHGRDLFVPVAALLVRGELPDAEPTTLEGMVGSDWPRERACICYIDAFGNLMTGLQAVGLSADTELFAAGRGLKAARTFAEVAIGEAFWYSNAFGLVELAVNQGRADTTLGLGLGAPVELR
jgi:S-adenosylmethionine hydrolase